MSSFFSGCSSLENVILGPKFTCDKMTDIRSMFFGCSSLKSVDLSVMTPVAATTMEQMFQNCSSLESINLTMNDGGAGFEKVTSADYAFSASSSYSPTKTTAIVYLPAHFNEDTDSPVLTRSGRVVTIDGETRHENLVILGSGEGIDVNNRCDYLTLRDDKNYDFYRNIYAENGANYNRAIAEGEVSTLCLPYTRPVPDGLKAYTLTGVSGGDNSGDSGNSEASGLTLTFSPVDTLVAGMPYLVKAETALAAGDESNPACDVNDDTHLSLADVTALVNLLLTGM